MVDSPTPKNDKRRLKKLFCVVVVVDVELVVVVVEELESEELPLVE